MIQGIKRRFVSLFSKVNNQKYSKRTSEVSSHVIKSAADPEPLLKRTQKAAADKELFNKDDSSDILVLRQEPLGDRDIDSLIRRNNSLTALSSYTLQHSRNHLNKIPGPKFEVADVLKKNVSIFRSQVITSFMQFLHNFPLGPGSYFTWMKNIRPYNNLFEKYGDIVSIQTGPLGGDIVLLRKPEHFNIVFNSQNEEDIYQPCLLESLDAYAQQKLTSVGSHSLKLISLTEDFLEKLDFVSTFKRSEDHDIASNAFIKRIEELNQLQYEVPPDFFLELCKWGLSWQQYLLFKPENVLFLDNNQLKFNSEGAKMLSAFTEASEAVRKCESGFQFWRFYNTPSWTKLISSCDNLTTSFMKQIDKARTDLVEQQLTTGGSLGPPFQNLIEHLITEKDTNIDNLLRELLEMTLIGVNVTAFSMGFLLYHLSKSPRVQTKLHDEIKRLYKDKSANIQFNGIDKLVYVKACVKEALRLQLAIPFSICKLHKDISISQYLIPKETYIVMAHETACLSKDNFEDPDRFIPERWTAATAQSLLDPLNIQQYGNGVCSSIIKRFAEEEMCLLTAKIIKNYWIDSYEEVTSDGKMLAEITSDGKILAMPTQPFRFSFKQRHN